MSVAGASLIGAAILALVALLTSFRGKRRGRAATPDFASEALKTVVAAGMATGFCFIALAMAEASQLLPDWAELGVLLLAPATYVVISRLGMGRRRRVKGQAATLPIAAH